MDGTVTGRAEEGGGFTVYELEEEFRTINTVVYTVCCH